MDATIQGGDNEGGKEGPEEGEGEEDVGDEGLLVPDDKVGHSERRRPNVPDQYDAQKNMVWGCF